MLAIRPGFYGELAAPTDGITLGDSFMNGGSQN